MYTEKMLAHVAKRENNNKRKYLVVNPMQGKHVPVSGKAALSMFDALAEKVKAKYGSDNFGDTLLVGFAETATAIGAHLAVTLGSFYMQTTREPLENADHLFFTESHSHATEQKLCKNDIEDIIGKIGRIVFVEDEVTTGNTIMKIVEIIKKLYPNAVRFSVASLLNGMDDEHLAVYSEKGIDVIYLVKTHHEGYTAIAEKYVDDGCYIEADTTPVRNEPLNIRHGYINSRRLCSGTEYGKACSALAGEITEKIPLNDIKTAAVIGTEEFMYPAIFTAAFLEDCGINTVTHSTTRSPIAVSLGSGYPLTHRYSLSSLFDKDRKTYVYDLKKYDLVIVLTDAPDISDQGKASLVNALKLVGNDNIHLIRWCKNED